MPEQTVSIFRLTGNDNQNRIVADALSRCTFPFERLRPALGARVRRDYIPVTWNDLSRWTAAAEKAKKSGGHHTHVHENGATGHLIEVRNAAMGLAWTDGRIELDYSCEREPFIGGAVMLAEVAHMVDFFYLTDEQRSAIFRVMHAGSDAPHEGHGWWEEAGNQDYYATMGETFMVLFVRGYAAGYESVNFGPFVHQVDAGKVAQVRQIVLPTAPEPIPQPPLPPLPDTPVTPAPYFGTRRGQTYHDKHDKVRREVTWESVEAAKAAGRKPCRVCKPR